VASLAQGRSTIRKALLKGDGESAMRVAVSLGAAADLQGDTLHVDGVGMDLDRGIRELDCGNSGTSMRLFTGAVSLGRTERRFDGDSSLRTRKMRPLLKALAKLGATVQCESETLDVPFTVRGPIRGGHTDVSGVTSQFLSSLLFACPLARGNSVVEVSDALNEKPYVELTLWWLKRLGVRFEALDGLRHITVEGSQQYAPIDMDIPSDFSSATFAAAAAVLTGSTVTLTGLDFSDPQGDKAVFEYLAQMGGTVEHCPEGVRVSAGRRLVGGEIDLNATPDALPAMAVLATAAEGETRLLNVPQARIKETDRIAVMAKELGRLGASVTELPDGMVIRGGELKGATVNGHDDHRVVMALALAGMRAKGETVIEGAEAATVTYPTFREDFAALGARISVE
jgi:3-phosphoshikimate 1-carboxyvinyltransferase